MGGAPRAGGQGPIVRATRWACCTGRRNNTPISSPRGRSGPSVGVDPPSPQTEGMPGRGHSTCRHIGRLGSYPQEIGPGGASWEPSLPSGHGDHVDAGGRRSVHARRSAQAPCTPPADRTRLHACFPGGLHPELLAGGPCHSSPLLPGPPVPRCSSDRRDGSGTPRMPSSLSPTVREHGSYPHGSWSAGCSFSNVEQFGGAGRWWTPTRWASCGPHSWSTATNRKW
jgi:hypothetical protein